MADNEALEMQLREAVACLVRQADGGQWPPPSDLIRDRYLDVARRVVWMVRESDACRSTTDEPTGGEDG